MAKTVAEHQQSIAAGLQQALINNLVQQLAEANAKIEELTEGKSDAG